MKTEESILYWIFAILIFLSIPPWFVWGLGEVRMQIVSVATLFCSLRLASIKGYFSLKFGILYLFTSLFLIITSTNGLSILTHLELSTAIFLCCCTSAGFALILNNFEKLLSVILTAGILIYVGNFFFDLPYFEINPLNKGKINVYVVRIFEIKNDFYSYNRSFTQFMSVFDEPGVIGTLSAFLLCRGKLDLRSNKNIIFLISGIISFSLAFYVVMAINLVYYKQFNLRISLLIFTILFTFYAANPAFVEEELISRFVVDNAVGIQDNRQTQEFSDYFDNFVEFASPSEFLFGQGVNKLNRNIQDVNASSAKMLLVVNGLIAAVMLFCLFAYFTFTICNNRRGWYIFFVFILLAYQRPGIIQYFNIMLYLGVISEVANRHLLKRI